MSDGCEVPGGTSSSASPWLWQLQHTTVRSRTPPHGDRRQAPEPVRRRFHEAYLASQGLKRPPPGVRPGVLEDPALQLGSERAACPRSLVPPLELPRLAADESLDSATLAFLVGASLEQEKEKEEEEEVPKELYSQRASLQHYHSGEWSSLGMGTAKVLRSWGSNDECLVRFSFVNDRGVILADLPVVQDHPQH